MSKFHPLKDNQRLAVQPERTVWLSASAGTGKTQVLSARVLRLLLQDGVTPDQILCLTFTKAGAAEMATRVNDVLARWVRLPDTELAGELGAIGASMGPQTVARARSLFAAVLDCPGGGLRIETIHAFSQWLLGAFPAEAGLIPGTRAMEDRDRDLLLREVLANLLITAQEQGDEALFAALEDLSLRMGEDAVPAFLLRCAGAHGLWEGPGAWQPPLRPRINRLLGLDAEEDGSGLADLVRDGVFDVRAAEVCMEANQRWGSKTGLDAASIMRDWLEASPAARIAGIDDFAAQFLTKAGTPRAAKNLEKHEPAYADYQACVIEDLGRVQEMRALIGLAARLDPALTLGRRFALAWAEAKAREGFIDFDDQIRAAADLLTKQAPAEWIRYKLDRRFDHILVDEAQDTNTAQWRIVLDGLVGDFFSGEGQKDGNRTLFVVGDYKQAIFGFQGTSPENFAAARERVRRELDALAEATADPTRELLPLGLGRSYRTAASVLAFVDRAISAIGPDRFGLPEAPEPHQGDDSRPGMVTLWKPVGGKADEDDDTPPGEGDEGEESWLSRPDRVMADQIAQQVEHWLDAGFPLHKGQSGSGPRRATPGDIMVLVRSRKALAGLIVARLHARGVPVAGVDRLRLGAPLAVKDLVAVLRFCAQPLDDLNLAALLVSPLVGWTQDMLLEHGYRAKGTALWDHLRASEGPATHPAMEQLRGALSRADFGTPAQLLHWLLVGPWQGRQRLVARLGAEANDPIDELINAAAAYASGQTPSLVGFLQWFDAGDGELKREAGQKADLVRVMTVHGSKGLEAPIVILADAAADPDKSSPRGLSLEEQVVDERRTVPLPPLRKAEQAGPVRDAAEYAAATEREEHWRLLYVAMTRAEEALFIGGALGTNAKGPPEESWYAQLAPLFGDEDGDWREDPIWGASRQLGGLGPLPAAVRAEEPAPEAADRLPDWLDAPLPAEPRPPRPLAPSGLGEADDAPDPPSRTGPAARMAARRGSLMHKLIERLPELAAEAREAAALGWLARMAADVPEDERAAMAASAIRVLAEPAWAEVFGPGSLAEVPIAAVVGERVVSGTLDRLLLAQTHVRVVDFKTARRPPQDIGEVPLASLRQMAAYVAALEVIYPGRRIEAALLYTHTPRLIVLPEAVIAAHKPALQGPQESF
ncbi:double-strand break repair helicase AddA [Novosphingobium sp. PASSN1]|uniref:double-strand break repair helicase AddA n=1 Tax=Novosphingobium sp. PASSN1 TaxID=2015561 RepID=UPI000BD45553|nr:double-strand break repair helicase AddA [Novosphingobium sp. PASSN1]OYU35328.1 MAG: double-strand break repair helicase AddA [Novosphingobium sp. PASSN1]